MFISLETVRLTDDTYLFHLRIIYTIFRNLISLLSSERVSMFSASLRSDLLIQYKVS